MIITCREGRNYHKIVAKIVSKCQLWSNPSYNLVQIRTKF